MAISANFILELKTEADLEISSPEKVEPKVFKYGGIFKDFQFAQTFQIRTVMSTPVDKNIAKVS